MSNETNNETLKLENPEENNNNHQTEKENEINNEIEEGEQKELIKEELEQSVNKESLNDIQKPSSNEQIMTEMVVKEKLKENDLKKEQENKPIEDNIKEEEKYVINEFKLKDDESKKIDSKPVKKEAQTVKPKKILKGKENIKESKIDDKHKLQDKEVKILFGSIKSNKDVEEKRASKKDIKPLSNSIRSVKHRRKTITVKNSKTMKNTDNNGKLKLFVSKKKQTDQENINNSVISKKRCTLKSVPRKKLNPSFNPNFDELSYLESQLNLAEIEKLKLRADLKAVEDNIINLRANIFKAKNKQSIDCTQNDSIMIDNIGFLNKIDKLRKEQTDRVNRIKQKATLEQENLLKQLEERNKEMKERVLKEKHERHARNIEAIKKRSQSRKKQLKIGNKLMKNLMEGMNLRDSIMRSKINDQHVMNYSFNMNQ